MLCSDYASVAAAELLVGSLRRSGGFRGGAVALLVAWTVDIIDKHPNQHFYSRGSCPGAKGPGEPHIGVLKGQSIEGTDET
jgi:hypothetical protein